MQLEKNETEVSLEEARGQEKSKGKKKKRRRKKKKRISRKLLKQIRRQRRYRLGMGLFSLIFMGALLFIGCYYARQKRAESLYESLRWEHSTNRWMRTDLWIPPKQEEAEPVLDPSLWRENAIDFGKLWELNSDIYAWIEIPGTLVDYPILQHPADDVYYLNHTVEKAEGLPGSIYSESIHAKDFSDPQTVLYGHNMKNDTMFGSLHDYEEEGKLKESPYIYIYLPERTLVYQIFAAVQFSDAYLPVYCNYEEEEEFLKFVEGIRESPGEADKELEIAFGSRLLTLSTCIGNEPEHRFLVEAMYLGEYERNESSTADTK